MFKRKFKIINRHLNGKWYFAIKTKKYLVWRYIYKVGDTIESPTGLMFAKVALFDTLEQAEDCLKKLSFEKVN